MNDAMLTETTKEQLHNESAETDKQYILCPCCKTPTLTKPIKINEELVDHFICCMISGVPFWHKYQLFNGKLSVTVTNLTNTDLIKMMSACRVLDTLSKKYPQDNNDIENLITALRLYSNISDITLHREDTKTYTPIAVCNDIFTKILKIEPYLALDDLSETPVHDILEESFAIINTADIMSAVPQIQLLKIVGTHQQVYSILLDNGFDENFWTGIELA